MYEKNKKRRTRLRTDICIVYGFQLMSKPMPPL